jgi:NADPH-dependent curcumin reductase CurA
LLFLWRLERLGPWLASWRNWQARAVGLAGGDAKCAYVRDELGFDAVVDYKARDLSNALSAACPDGIDFYFENVGGPTWDAVLLLLNRYARVPVCGLTTTAMHLLSRALPQKRCWQSLGGAF